MSTLLDLTGTQATALLESTIAAVRGNAAIWQPRCLYSTKAAQPTIVATMALSQTSSAILVDTVDIRMADDGLTVAALLALVSGAELMATGASTGGLSDAQLRATPVPVSGSVSVGTVPVTGPLTDAQIRATALPVSGPLTDAQLRAVAVPVSGTVTANAGTGTLAVSLATAPSTPVTGTFWQGTQPVSGPLTDTQLRATAVPVSLASTTVTGSVAVTGPLTDAQLRATAVPVSGTVTANAGTGTLAVSAASLPLPAGAATSALQAVPTLTKGTQGATGYSVQKLSDAGRVIKTYRAVFTGATTEAILTLTPNADGVDGGTGTTFAVTSGKKLRLNGISVNTKNAGAAGQGIVCNLRMNPSGAAVVTSPTLATVGAGTELAIANVVGSGFTALDLELSGTMQLAITGVGTATAGNTVTLMGFEY